MAKMYKRNLFTHLQGLGQFSQADVFRIEVDGEFLVILQVKVHVLGSDEVIQKYQIKASDILDFGIAKKSELEKKSVIGDGIVGGLLFGPVGAMLGGLSASTKSKIKSVLAISFLPSAGDEPKTIMFDAEPVSWGSTNALWAAKAQKQLADIQKSDRVRAYLGQTINIDGSITL